MTYGRPPYFVISYAVGQQGAWANLALVGSAGQRARLLFRLAALQPRRQSWRAGTV